MRSTALALCLMIGFSRAATTPKPKPASFETDVKPILAQRCTPCHFAGGKMYDRLPFDKPETIVKLGERLFTRIKDEEARGKIRAFLRSANP
jgi:hypothetical protein